MATTIDVTTELQLNNAIAAIDGTVAGDYVINLGSSITEGNLPAVSVGTNSGGTVITAVPDLAAIDLPTGVTLTIDGNGNSLIGTDITNGVTATFRGLFVQSGNVTVNDLTIRDAVATGGAGGSAGNFAGGGGAGLGGGLLIGATGTVTLNQVYFSGDAAIGGAGGGSDGGGPGGSGDGSYAGGGGLGGAGGGYLSGNNAAGGGGIGRTAVGGSAAVRNVTPAGTGIVDGTAPGGAGQSGFAHFSSVAVPAAGSGGLDGGGGGAGFSYFNGANIRADDSGAGGGGGGIGGAIGQNGTADSTTDGAGGQGGFGGGGGGGYTAGGTGGFGGGGGGGYRTAGAGGWGGGGAGGGGVGGFGGGSGGGHAYAAGNGAGANYAGGGGGGGLGAGGDVFVYTGGSLIIGSGTLSGGSVAGGAGGTSGAGSTSGAGGAASNGGSGGAAGAAIGTGIFLYGSNQAATFTPALGQSVIVDDAITDQQGAGNGPNNGSVLLDGAGMLVLSNSNAYFGGTTIEAGGTLDLDHSGAAGSGAISFGSGSNWLEIQNAVLASGTLGNVVTNFAAGDAIDLHGIAYSAGEITNYTTATGELSIIDGGSTVASLFFAAGDSLGVDSFHLGQETGGTGIVVTDDTPCFLRGTQILTDAGEVAVETLSVGDRVITLSGEAKPIAWIGCGRVTVTRGRRCAATPIVVRKAALGNNLPHHDLHITKGHALFLDDVLIPVEFLVNHRSIAWDDRAQEVAFFHIELATHDVLLANGAPAETYRDDGNRWLFQNANTGWDQPPKPPCAPVLTGGPIVDAAWRRLLALSGPRKLPPLTDDPDLHLLVDGQRIDAAERHDQVYVFHLPRSPESLRIVSRDAVPAELGLARDARSLGVALRRIVARRGTEFSLIEASDPRLEQGFHAFEQWDGAPPDQGGIRWTEGDAALPAAAIAGFADPFELVLHLGGRMRYIADAGAGQAAGGA
jgi:hypothetical protein